MVDRVSGLPRRDSGSDRTDAIFRIAIVALVVAVLALGGFFGYSVYAAKRAEKSATPAQRAIQDLRDAVQKNPNDSAARVRLGEALATAGRLDEAVEQLKVALKIDDKHTGAWLDLGLIAMQEKDPAQAEQYFQKVVELTEGAQYEDVNNRREAALFHLGEIALAEKRYEDAAGFFKGALRIRKDASDTYYLLAQAYQGLDEGDAALEQLDAALAFDPNYAEAHYLYGVILLDKGDLINAAIHLRKAVDLAPTRKEPAEALKKLGTSSAAVDKGRKALEAGDVTGAIEDALLAESIDPKNADAFLLHADALVKKGDKKGALKVLTDARANLSGNEGLEKAITALGGK